MGFIYGGIEIGVPDSDICGMTGSLDMWRRFGLA
jgi:hypothetical protein